jgi:hypothetical protein
VIRAINARAVGDLTQKNERIKQAVFVLASELNSAKKRQGKLILFPTGSE